MAFNLPTYLQTKIIKKFDFSYKILGLDMLSWRDIIGPTEKVLIF